MKQEINLFEHANEILDRLRKGVLLTAKKGDKINPMTIGWGSLGNIWAKPMFVAMLRTGRCTREILDEALEFTVNIPLDDSAKQIIAYCGTHSGHDEDKVEACSLTPVESDVVNAPGFKELPLTLECRVVYRREQDVALLEEGLREKWYPSSPDEANPGTNSDPHVIYYGEIVKAYVIKA